MTWKTIDSAPKDGTEILAVIKVPTDEVKKWIDDHHAPCTQRFFHLVIRFWRGNWCANVEELLGVPTHWMPLPELPNTVTSDEPGK